MGFLSQGVHVLVEGTDTVFFIDKQYIPVDRWKDVTFGRVVADYHPDKSGPYCTRLTVGGDRVNYPGDCGTPTVSLTTVRLLLSITVSKIDAHFITIDIKDYYLNTPMARCEYMHLKISDLPKSVVQQYNMEAKATRDWYVHVGIRRGVYGIPQAVLTAQHLL